MKRSRSYLLRGTIVALAMTGSAMLALFASNLLPLPFGVRQEQVDNLRLYLREGHFLFTPYPYTNWIAADALVTSVDPVDWKFRVPEEDVVRIACIGGSTTYGSYPLYLKECIDEEWETDAFVMNWGVPGWTTAESLVNYFLNVQDYEPDIVVIHHALNDIAPRLRVSPAFRGDYAHWRKHWTDPPVSPLRRFLALSSDFYAAWVLSHDFEGDTLDDFVERPGDPVPDDRPLSAVPEATPATFRRNILTIAEHAASKGAEIVLMTMPFDPDLAAPLPDRDYPPIWVPLVRQHNQALRDIAAEKGYFLVDAEATAHEHPASAALFMDRVHLHEDGKRLKARAVADVLTRRSSFGPARGR